MRRFPIYAADYVLLGLRHRRDMAVPAHDERDFEFARKLRYTDPNSRRTAGMERDALEEAYAGEGPMVTPTGSTAPSTAKAKRP